MRKGSVQALLSRLGIRARGRFAMRITARHVVASHFSRTEHAAAKAEEEELFGVAGACQNGLRPGLVIHDLDALSIRLVQRVHDGRAVCLCNAVFFAGWS